MIVLSPAVLLKKPNNDGSYSIKIAIRTNNTSAYITTPYKITSAIQWSGNRVVRNPQAAAINNALLKDIAVYEQRLAKLPNMSLTASQVKKYLEKYSTSIEQIKTYVEQMIAGFHSEGRDSYAKNMGYTLKYLMECFGEGVCFEDINVGAICEFEKFLKKRGDSTTTINIRMSHLKAILNSAVDNEVAEYKVFPFRKYKMPAKEIRDICISRAELQKLKAAEFAGVSARRLTVARDLFMLSFYLGGINLTDLWDADVSGDVLTFVRKKTADKKQGEKRISITIQPHARAIIDKYITEGGRLDFGYKYSQYEQFRSFVTKSLNRIGTDLQFEKKLMYYSARKTFCQFGFELGIPLYILEYAIGQTVKDANNRPIFNYIRIMRAQADEAIKAIIDYSEGTEDNAI